MLHPIRETAHFMNWPDFCPLHELASTLAHFTNWAILCSFSAHFMNWTGFYVAFLRLGCWPLHIFYAYDV
jgi:hypothetical protein